MFQSILFGFLLFAILWRGGKSLETTWIFVGVSVLLTAMQMRRKSADRPRVPALVVLSCFMFLAWTFCSYWYSMTQNYGLDEVLRDIASILLFFSTFQAASLSDRPLFLRRLCIAVTIATLLAIAFGILVYILQPVNRFVGTFFDHRFHTDYWPNAWAQYLLLAWPLVFLWATSQQRMMRVVAGGILGCILGALLLSYSRGALIAFGLQGILLLLFSVYAETEHPGKMGSALAFLRRTAVRIFLLGAVALSMFLSVNILRSQFYPVQSVVDKVTFQADEGMSSVSERTLFWKQAIVLAARKPLFGWGPYSFRFVAQEHQSGVLQISDHPHNLFLKLAAERGIPASILFLLIIFLVMYCGVRRAFAASYDRSIPASQVIVLSISLLGVLAHNLIDYNLQFVGIAALFWVLLGCIASYPESERVLLYSAAEGNPMGNAYSLYNKIVRLFTLSLGLIALCASLIEGGFLVTSSLGRHAEAASKPEIALKYYSWSRGEWFSRDMHLSRALLYLKLGDVDSALLAIDDYQRVNSLDPRAWRVRGDIAVDRKDPEAAVSAYTDAFARGKWNDLSITLALTKALRALEPKHAVLDRHRAEIDAMLTVFAASIQRNDHFIALSHNAEDAIALASLLAEIYPKDAPTYEVIAARTDHAMRQQRSLMKSRPPGYLW